MKLSRGHYGLVLLSLTVWLTPMHGQDIPDALQNQLALVRHRLAPDKRTAVFDVHCTQVDGKRITLQGDVQDSGMKTELLRILANDGWQVEAASLNALPQTSLGGATWGVVTVSVLNIRSKPDQAAELATQAILGTPLRVLKQKEDWYLVQTPDHYLGWTEGRFQRMTDSAFNVWNGTQKVIVTATYGFASASETQPDSIVGDLVAGSILSELRAGDTGFDVQYPDGRKAFVKKGDCITLDRWRRRDPPNGNTIVSTARTFTGIPYLWGGTSAKAMDCSGFTKTVYFLNGILLPRDASQQVNVGFPVDGGDSLDQFSAGDLLFFGFAAKGEKKERVTHVAISLGGRRYIHSSGDVHINSLDPSDQDFNSHRRQMFLRARRILGAGKADGIQRIVEMKEYGR